MKSLVLAKFLHSVKKLFSVDGSEEKRGVRRDIQTLEDLVMKDAEFIKTLGNGKDILCRLTIIMVHQICWMRLRRSE